MSDLIDRQAAIDAIVNCTNCGDEKTLRAYVAKHNLDNGWTGGILEAIDAIEDLPSAQPDLDEWCTDCKEYDQERHNCPRWNRVIRKTVDELRAEQAEIIHCADCNHRNKYHFPPQYEERDYCEKHEKVVQTDWYCSWAERRQE